MDNKKRKVSAVSEILPGLLEEISRNNPQEQIQLEKIWADMLIAMDNPQGIALNGFKEGTVFLIVDSSARLYHWKIRRPTVLKRFQERRPDVKNIAFKIGKVT